MASDDAERSEIQMHATAPDGQHYSIGSFTGEGVAGPAFLGVETDAPRWAHSLVSLVNRGLGVLPRRPTKEPLTVCTCSMAKVGRCA